MAKRFLQLTSNGTKPTAALYMPEGSIIPAHSGFVYPTDPFQGTSWPRPPAPWRPSPLLRSTANSIHSRLPSKLIRTQRGLGATRWTDAPMLAGNSRRWPNGVPCVPPSPTANAMHFSDHIGQTGHCYDLIDHDLTATSSISILV